MPAGGRALDDEHAELVRRFGSRHEPIPHLLDLISAADVIRSDAEELAQPLPRYHHGRIALVGDAAHAMTPNLGQGGCQAVEDAITLAVFARPDSAPNLEPALARYTAERRPRTTRIVKQSRRAGAAGQWQHPVAVATRDALIRLSSRLPSRLLARAFASVYDWHPPPPDV